MIRLYIGRHVPARHYFVHPRPMDVESARRSSAWAFLHQVPPVVVEIGGRVRGGIAGPTIPSFHTTPQRVIPERDKSSGHVAAPEPLRVVQGVVVRAEGTFLHHHSVSGRPGHVVVI